MKDLRTVLEGLFLTAVATGTTVASAHAGIDPALSALFRDTAVGALGNFAHGQVLRMSDHIIERLSRGGNDGELPLNHDVARAVRMAQVRAVEAIAKRIIESLKPTEEDYAAQPVTAPSAAARLDKFLDRILKWRHSVENDIKTRWLELPNREEVVSVASNIRTLLRYSDALDVGRGLPPIWKKSGALMLAELNDFPILDRPPVFDEVLSGRTDIEGVTWANTVIAFFAETLKSDAAVYRMVSINLLEEIGGGVSGLQSLLTTQAKGILLSIQEGLGPTGEALARIGRQLDQFAANDGELSVKIDRILAILASVPVEEAKGRLERWVGSEYANYGLTAARVRDLIGEQSRFFIGRVGDLEALDHFVNDHEHGLLIVAAPAGIGKSALLVEWMGRRREVGDFVARHIIARRAPETVGPTAVLEHLLRQLAAYRAEPEAMVPDTESKLADAIFEHLRLPARDGERLIVLIDGLDEADASLTAFARQEMGAGVFVVLGVRAESNVEPDVLKRWLLGGLGNLPRVRHDVGPLSVEEIAQWLHAVMPAARIIDEQAIAGALSRISRGVPLFLRFVMDDFVRTIADAGLEKAREGLDALPGSFSKYVRDRLHELDQVKDGAWGTGPRKLFALLTQTLGPISARELRKGSLTPPELNLRLLDHRIERWFSISGDGADRTFAFSHSHLAKIFGEILGDEAEDAQSRLCAHCESWSKHMGSYALSFAPDHLIALAASAGWSRLAVERAAEPLLSLDFHRLRLILPVSDYLVARVPPQIRRLSDKADARLAERLRIWASALAEAESLVATHAMPDRDEAGRLLSLLIVDFSQNLEVSTDDIRLIKTRSALRGRPSPFFLALLEGHRGWVLGALALTDGRLLSWSGGGGELCLWDSDGIGLALLEGHENRVNGALELADGRLLSWSNDGTLRMWSGEGAPLATMEGRKFEGHTLAVEGALELADGRILSWGIDTSLRLWSADGVPLAVLEGHASLVRGALELGDGRLLSWSDGSQLAQNLVGRAISSENSSDKPFSLSALGFLAQFDCSLRLWTRDGDAIAVLKRHLMPQGPVRASRSHVVTLEQSEVMEARRVFGDEIPMLEYSTVFGGAIELRNGNILSWGDFFLRLWSGSGAPLALFEGHYGLVNGARELADGRVLSWDSEGTLRLWKPDGTALAALEDHAWVLGALVLTNGRVVSWGFDGTLRLWDDDGMALALLNGHTAFVLGALALADGRLLSWSMDGTLRLWSGAGEALRVLEGHTDSVATALSLTDGRLLSCGVDGTLRLWSGQGGAVAVLGGHASVVRGALELADGRLLSWSDDGTLRLWSESGEAAAVLEGHAAPVKGALLLTDGSLLSWSDDGTLRLWSESGEAAAVLEGHADPVKGALELDNGRILSWSGDGTLRLWSEAGDGGVVLGGHSSAVEGAMELTDGRLLSWGEDHTLRLWSGAGETGAVLVGHSSAVRGALVLLDGRLLSWSNDGTLRLWNAMGEMLAVLLGHTARVRGATELVGGRLVSWSKDGTLRLWSSTGAALAVLEGHDIRLGHVDSVDGALELNDGRVLSWSGDSTLRLWNSEGDPVETLEGHVLAVNGALELADGGLLSWSADHTLRLWGDGGDAVAILEGHTQSVDGALAVANGARVVSWSRDGTLRLWSTEVGGATLFTGHETKVNGVLAIDDGRFLSWGVDGTLRLWTDTGAELAVLKGHQNFVRGALALADGRFLSWSGDDTLRLWSNEGAPLTVLEGHGTWVNVALQLADGRIVSGGNDGAIRLWTDEGEAIAVLKDHSEPMQGILELAASRLLSWSLDGALRLWSKAGAPLAVLDGHEGWVNGALVLRDGRLLSWGEDRTLRLWSGVGAPLAVLEGHEGRLEGALELDDGRLLSWCLDGTLRLWSGEGVALSALEGHADGVLGAQVLGDGRLLSWSADATLHLWSSVGVPLAALDRHSDWVKGALALTNGRLLSWSDDGTARLWNGEGDPLDLWATPMGPITNVVASAKEKDTFAVVVNRHVLTIEISS